jgi:hypothetical protein
LANYSAAFGYDVYIVPLDVNSVDSSFTGVTAGITSGGGTGFVDTGTANDNVVAANATVAYSNGIFTVAASAYNMDGDDPIIRLYGLTNASLETDTNTEEVVTYDSETGGFNLSVPTSKTWSISLSGVADFKDAGYQIMRLTEQNTVADALRVKFVRVGPTGTTETVYGYGMLSGYTESIEAGSIVSWEATIAGYGPYRVDLDVN